ncbi:hypothetical protein HWV62_24634 [Athelia sp. TMB]|nr:hypothetical protein HWV62_24634 [Athelia sp. TMB]
MSQNRYTIIFFVPKDHTQSVLDKLFQQFPKVLGSIGNYENCAFYSPGTGQFIPAKGSNPVIGAVGRLEHVEEHRVEMVVNDTGERAEIKAVIEALKSVHPYEEVAYYVHRLEDL